MLHRSQPIVIYLALALLSGCANTPRQSVELSAALTAQVTDMQKAHIALVNRYFDEVEARVRQTITIEYKDGLVQGMKDKQKEKGRELTLDQYDKIMTKVLSRQDQAMSDLQKSRSDVLSSITERYILMRSESQSLHRLLAASSKLQEERQKYTGAFEAKTAEGLDFLERVDSKVKVYMDEANRVKEGINKIKSDASEVLDARP